MSWPRQFGPDAPDARSRSDRLQKLGPVLQVILTNPFADEINAAPPVVSDAMVDTGASCICVDNRAARELRLQKIAPTNLIAVGASHPSWLYAARVQAPELDFDRIMQVCAPDGVRVTPRILLGRSFLQYFSFSFNGISGVFTFHNSAAEVADHHDIDE